MTGMRRHFPLLLFNGSRVELLKFVKFNQISLVAVLFMDEFIEAVNKSD